MILDDTLKGSRASMELLDVGDFLEYVKNRFSDVLLPVNTITKQGLLGKGYICGLFLCFLYVYDLTIHMLVILLCSLGAFGVVHKGEMTSPDGSLTAVAIKTIKCEICYLLSMYMLNINNTYIA